MIQYTTLTLPLLVEGVDITGADDVYVTISDKPGAVVVTDDSPTLAASGNDTSVTATFGQTDTGKFVENTTAIVQVNWMDNGSRKATLPAEIHVYENLIKEVLT